MAVCTYRTLCLLLTLTTSMTISLKYDYGNSSINKAKSWMTYLTYSLETWLFNTKLTVVQYLEEVRSPIGHMIEWCEPPKLENLENYNETRSVSHLERWTPCGYGVFNMFTADRNDITPVLQIWVYRMYYIHFMFLNFEVDDSNFTCAHSVVHIMTPKVVKNYGITWLIEETYCGYREPWNRTVASSRALLYIKQLNVYRLLNLTMKYVTIDTYLEKFYRPNVNVTNLFLTSYHTLSLSYSSKFIQQCDIQVNLGFVQIIQLVWISASVNYLKIFDGLKVLFPLFTFSKGDSVSFNQTVNCTTQYFQSHIVIENENNAINHPLVNLTFRIVQLDAIHLHHNTETNLKSSAEITHAVFSMRPFRGRFAGLSITFHKFQGWNWGGCNYGGYAILQNIDDPVLSPTTFGPFCSAASPRHAYTSQHTLPQFIMNNRLAYLIIYGYGSMYAIDIDIKIIPTPCEGIMEPLMMWYPDKGKTRKIPQDVITTTFATVTYKISPTNRSVPLHKITVQNISRCFCLQSISYITRKLIYYNILFKKADVIIYHFLPLRYVDSWNHLPYGFISVIFTHDFGKPVLQYFKITKVFTTFDIQSVGIEHYTGEAYDFVSFFAVFVPMKEILCDGEHSSKEKSFQRLLENRGYIYATTYKYCILNMIKTNSTYVFVLTSHLPRWYKSKSIWYLHFQKFRCEQNSTERDTLTTRLVVDSSHMTSHTVDFIKEEVFLQSLHRSLSFVYRKIQPCDEVILKYRDVGENLLASYMPMDNQDRARIRVSNN